MNFIPKYIDSQKFPITEFELSEKGIWGFQGMLLIQLFCVINNLILYKVTCSAISLKQTTLHISYASECTPWKYIPALSDYKNKLELYS